MGQDGGMNGELWRHWEGRKQLVLPSKQEALVQTAVEIGEQK